MIYTVLAIWIIYSILEGWREAPFWHHRIKSLDYIYFKDVDRHPLFSAQRGIVLITLFLLTYYIDGVWVALFLSVMNMLIFSFFHNGMMYTIRHQMSKIVSPEDETKWIYNKKWFAQSTTSTSWMTKLMGPISRTIQAGVGIVGYIIWSLI